MKGVAILLFVLAGWLAALARAADPTESNMTPPINLKGHPSMTWLKRSPGPGAPVSPRMGYEASWGWDARGGVIVRWGGHNQGGGGEQNFETWLYDPIRNTWALCEPNTSPPGNCCCRDNVSKAHLVNGLHN